MGSWLRQFPHDFRLSLSDQVRQVSIHGLGTRLQVSWPAVGDLAQPSLSLFPEYLQDLASTSADTNACHRMAGLDFVVAAVSDRDDPRWRIETTFDVEQAGAIIGLFAGVPLSSRAAIVS